MENFQSKDRSAPPLLPVLFLVLMLPTKTCQAHEHQAIHPQVAMPREERPLQARKQFRPCAQEPPPPRAGGGGGPCFFYIPASIPEGVSTSRRGGDAWGVQPSAENFCVMGTRPCAGRGSLDTDQPLHGALGPGRRGLGPPCFPPESPAEKDCLCVYTCVQVT